MTESHGGESNLHKRQQGWRRVECHVEPDALERQLDAALANYATVEPRPGLEGRVLANLHAERERAPVQVWWRWPAAAAVTVVVLILALFLSWKTRESEVGKTVGHNPTEDSREVPIGKVANPHLPSQPVASVRTAVANRPRHPVAVVTTAPRLPQFPSPRPLSEQEEILARYVATYPDHATLVAAARAEALRRDAAEQLRDPAGEGTSQP